MGCEAGRYKTPTPKGIYIVTPSLEGLPTKAKEAPSPHEVRLTPLDTNPVFQSLGGRGGGGIIKQLSIIKQLCHKIKTGSKQALI